MKNFSNQKFNLCFRSSALILLHVFLLLTVTVCHGQSPGGLSLSTVRLRLKWRHQFQFAGYYAAVDKGFYADAGMNVVISEAQVNEDTSEAVLNGNADFGIAGSDLLLLRAQGKPLVALAAVYQHSPMVFLTTAETGISNIHQLAGKRVMLEPHSAELTAYLQSEGIRLQDMTIVPHNFGVNELLSGQVDVISSYLTDEPFNILESSRQYRLFMPQAGGIDFYGDVLFTSETQIINYPDRVERFIEASKLGWKYALSNPEEIIDLILNKYSNRHSKEHLTFEAEKSMSLIKPNLAEIGHMNIGRWQHIMDKYKEVGLISDDVDLLSFVHVPEARNQSILRQAIQLMEIFFALLALGFVIKLIKTFANLEELDRKSRQNNKKLAKRKKNYEALLSNMPGMAFKCYLDSDWTMLYVSSGCHELTGYKPEELKHNRIISFSNLIVAEDRESVATAIEAAYREKRPYQITYRIMTANEKEKWVWEQGRFASKKTGLPVIKGFIADVTENKLLELRHEKAIVDLQKALQEIKTLQGIIPICVSCKKIRDDQGSWSQVEDYIRSHSSADFSHGICPDCAKSLYPEAFKKKYPAGPEN